MDPRIELLLTAHPEALVYAVGTDGIVVPMPESFKSGGRVLEGDRSALDMVLPEDKPVVFDAWEQARTTGLGTAHVRLAAEPDRRATLHYFDELDAHGAFIGLVVAGDAQQFVLSEKAPPRAPRFTRVRKNDLAVLTEIDESFTRILGWSAEEVVGKRTLEIIHPDDHALAIDNWMDMFAAHGPGRRVRLRHLHRDGSWLWMEITNHNLLEDPSYECVVAEMVDISDEMSTHEALRAREQLLNRLAEALPLGLLQVDAQSNVVYTNDRLHGIVGIERAETVEEQLASVLEEDRQVLIDAFDAVLLSGIDSDVEVRLRLGKRDKDVRDCAFNLRALTDEAGGVTGAIICVSDVTESARAREELRAQATRDVVTGSHNRASTLAALEEVMAMQDRYQRPAVIFVDLDHFKEVNDALGHAAGDQFLQVIADRLHACVRSNDVVGRLGGDEFLIVCQGVSSPREAMATASRVAEALRADIRINDSSFPSRASIGVAWPDRPDVTADELVAHADAAMYESKRRGTGIPMLYMDSPSKS